MLSGQPSVFFGPSLSSAELPHFEIRALAMIGAGLVKRHQGDPKAINKLSGLAVLIDGYRQNLTVKTLFALCKEAAGCPLYDEAIFLDIEEILAQRGNS